MPVIVTSPVQFRRRALPTIKYLRTHRGTASRPFVLVTDMDTRRSDRTPGNRAAFDKARKVILSTQDVCGICGKPVDKSLKSPHPLSKTVDHKIPVAKGGHPSDLDNLALAHRKCNRMKSDKLFFEIVIADFAAIAQFLHFPRLKP